MSILFENMLGYLSLDIICSSKLTVFLELYPRKIVRFSEQIMSADKYPSLFSRQMETIVYLACVASVSVGLGSKERPRNGILPARNWGESQNKKEGVGEGNEGSKLRR